jgi:hypothetical protein
MPTNRSVLTYALLSQAAAEGLTTEQTAERYGVSNSTVRYRTGIYGISLKGMTPKLNPKIRWDLIEKEQAREKKEPEPKPGLQESPITPTLIRLAEFDSIAKRALARKRGEPIDPPQHSRDLPGVMRALRLFTHPKRVLAAAEPARSGLSQPPEAES